MSTVRQWLGGRHDFFLASAWTPTGKPVAGDTAIIGPGTASAPSIAEVTDSTLRGLTILLYDGRGAFGSPYVPTLSLSNAAIASNTLIENKIETSPYLGASDTEAILISGTVRNYGTIAENPGALIGNTLNISIGENGR